MEISKISDSSLKIKGKNAAVVIDPTAKVDAEIVIAVQPLENLALDKVGNNRLIISGPGEYEAGGISVTGKDVGTGIMFQILENSKLLLVTSAEISSVPDDVEYDCLIVKIISEFKDDLLGPIHAKCVVLYGDLALATTTQSENVEKATKINTKKTAEIQGKTFIF